MFKHRVMSVLALWLSLLAPAVQAYVGPATLSPNDPIAGDVMVVDIPYGFCDLVSDNGDVEGYPQITIAGDEIRVVAATGHAFSSDFCIFPEGIAHETIGPLPAGTYTVTVDSAYINNAGEIVPIGVLPLTVRGAPPPAVATSVPTSGFVAEAIIGLLLVALGGFTIRRRSRGLLSVAVCALAATGGSRVNAQTSVPTAPPTIEVLLSTSPGAPTPNDIVNYFATSPRSPKPPLDALTVQSPGMAAYLMPRRATGDFLARLQATPNSPRATLERYVVVVYPPGADLDAALAAFQSEPYVQAAYISGSGHFSSAELTYFEVDDNFDAQYGRTDLNVDAAWQLAGGTALVGEVDTGLDQTHPVLAQFSSSGHYLGGNFVPIDSLDIGQSTTFIPGPNFTEANVDELNPVQVPSGSSCDTQGTGFAVPAFGGHGTHVSGLLAANADAGFDVAGTCKHCGIAMWKVTQFQCASAIHKLYVLLNEPAVGPAVAYLSDTGVQVVNESLGDSSKDGSYCSTNSTDPWCLAIAQAYGRDIVLVASSGNARAALDFPASDVRVIAAGGFQENLAIWDDSPGVPINTTHCPVIYMDPPPHECGSNFTTVNGGPRQELMASAHNVISTTYPNVNWNPDIECGDQFPGPGFGGGVGNCNGTSMSAPQISGVIGILRSINPLAPGGANPSVSGTVRNVLATTTFEAQAGHGFDNHVGYGRPDASAAARKMFGRAAGGTARNRATPLFRLYSSGANGGIGDYADTTAPQTAVALMLNATKAWQPVGSLPTVPNYASFPHSPDEGAVSTPRASVYVMTTEHQPRAEWPALVPLYLMDRDVGVQVADFMLATTVADIEIRAQPRLQPALDPGLCLPTLHTRTRVHSARCATLLSGLPQRRLRDISGERDQ